MPHLCTGFSICKYHIYLVQKPQINSRQSSLAAIPIQFAEERAWGPVTSELPFLGILLGTILGGSANVGFTDLALV